MHMTARETSFGRLLAPAAFWLLTPDQLREISNGMGPKGFGLMVPDTMWGLDVSICGDIHDFMYSLPGKKHLADKVFRENLFSVIAHKGGPLAFARRNRARIYFWAVDTFGRGA